MITTILTKSNELVMVDTEEDVLFARNTTHPKYSYYYSKKESVYMTLQENDGSEKILKRSVQEIKESLAFAEIIDYTTTEKVLEMLSD